jgi:hypothetical protein
MEGWRFAMLRTYRRSSRVCRRSLIADALIL